MSSRSVPDWTLFGHHVWRPLVLVQQRVQLVVEEVVLVLNWERVTYYYSGRPTILRLRLLCAEATTITTTIEAAAIN